MVKMITALMLILTSLIVSACNTTEGLGEDV